MAVSPEFRDFVLEQFGRIVRGVASRAMFGGVAISGPEGTFALIDEGEVFLKGDAASRPRFEEAGWSPFRPWGEEGPTMAYFAVPGELLEDLEGLTPWLDLAIEAARRAPRKKSARRRNR